MPEPVGQSFSADSDFLLDLGENDPFMRRKQAEKLRMSVQIRGEFFAAASERRACFGDTGIHSLTRNDRAYGSLFGRRKSVRKNPSLDGVSPLLLLGCRWRPVCQRSHGYGEEPVEVFGKQLLLAELALSLPAWDCEAPRS